jgi:hypothetical protein
MATMDAEPVGVLAGRAIGMEQVDELEVAGILVHEVCRGEVHCGTTA